MEDNPLVSVLMTAYNREKFIADAIESVLASSYTNFELIIVDDGSLDNTAGVAKKYEANDSRIRVSVNEQNLGDYPNRNKAASYAKGKYLKYVDSDDRILPQGLASMVNTMESFQDVGCGISSSYEYSGEEKLPIQLDSKEAYYYHYFKRPVFFASPGEVIFKRDTFNAVGGFSEKRMVSDFEMWHKISLHSPVVLMTGGMMWIRKHPGQEVADQQKFVLELSLIHI